MGVAKEMPRYRSHKEVWALKIRRIESAALDGTTIYFVDEGYMPVTVPAEMFTRYTPVEGDYLVVYDDGYKSISPAKAFDEGYKLIPPVAPGSPVLTAVEALRLLLDQIDYTEGACAITEQVAAALPMSVIAQCRAAAVRG